MNLAIREGLLTGSEIDVVKNVVKLQEDYVNFEPDYEVTYHCIFMPCSSRLEMSVKLLEAKELYASFYPDHLRISVRPISWYDE